MPRRKVADEVYCRSCGEPIKRRAEICPECGVRNSRYDSGSHSGGGADSPMENTASETTVSDRWYMGVLLAAIGWSLALIIPLAGESIDVFLGLVLMVAWVVMPVSANFDMRFIRVNSEWTPNSTVWTIAMILPYINVGAALVYLYRRYETVGIP